MEQIDTFERLTGLEGTIKKNKNSHEISTRAKKKLESQNNADALAIVFCSTSKAPAIWLQTGKEWARVK